MPAGEISAQLSTLILIVLLALITIAVIKVSDMRQKKRFRESLRKNYGKTPNIRYQAEEYDSIGRYAADRAEAETSFYVDDTTWNDIGMDDIFLMINNTVSSCGEDVLYSMLRLPAFDEKVLEMRDHLAEWIDSHEAERVNIQFALAGVGRKHHMSQYEYICKLDDAENVNTFRYAALLLLAVVNIALFFIRPVWGVFCLIPLTALNLRLQFRNEYKTRIYVQSFNSVLRLLAASKSISHLGYEELKPYTEELDGIRKKFAGFTRGSFVVTSSGQVGNGPGDAILEYLKLFFHLDMLKFNQMLNSYRGHREDCVRMIEILGTIDAAVATASFRRLLPYYCKPEWESTSAGEISSETGQTKTSLSIEEMFHPMIEEPVPNSFSMSGGNLVTGSNASGKSTFLKNCAICAVLAQGIGTVPAKQYRADFMKVMSSMALSDNLAAKESYFIVELKSIKRILDEADQEGKVLCLIDEVLRGTNTVERIAASSRILEDLDRPNVLAFAATHDIELSYLLEPGFTNWHFEESVTDEEVTFDYKLREGRATSRNAIRLLKVMGFEEKIVEGSRKRAERFDTDGVWE